MNRFTSMAVLGAVVTASVVAVEAPARAQSATDVKRAEQLFAEAVNLAAQEQYDRACPKFEESQRLDPALGTQFNLALCYESVGRLGAAWRNFRAVERLAHATAKTGREDAARQKLVALRPRVPHIVFTARDADATLKVDGEQVDRTEWDFYAVDPGDRAVEATAPAKAPWRTRVTVPPVANGVGAEIRIAIPTLTAVAGETRIVAVPKEATNTKRTVGLIVGAVGVVGIAAAAATGVVLLHDYSTAKESCTPTCVDQSGRDAISSGKTLLPINAIAWGVGLVGLGAGTFLVLTSKPSKPATARIQPFVAPARQEAGIVGTF